MRILLSILLMGLLFSSCSQSDMPPNDMNEEEPTPITLGKYLALGDRRNTLLAERSVDEPERSTEYGESVTQ